MLLLALFRLGKLPAQLTQLQTSIVPKACGELHYSEFHFANLQDKQKIGGSRKGWTDKAIHQKHSDNQSHCTCQAGTLSFFKEVACVYGCQTQGAHCSPLNFPTFPTKSCGLCEAKCGYYWQPCPGLKIWELLISSQVSPRTPSQFCDPSTKQESCKCLASVFVSTCFYKQTLKMYKCYRLFLLTD